MLSSVAGLTAGAVYIVASWAAVGLALAGVGHLARRACGRRDLSPEAALLDFWLGFALLVLFLQLWHFALPVNAAAAAVVGVAGAGGVALAWPDARRRLGGVPARRWLPLLVVAAAAVLWAANRASGPPTQYDTGMYHAPVVRWFGEHPVVPGLGNLHGRLAFNNSSLLYAALLEAVPWWAGRATHLANGLLVVAVIVQSLLAGWRILLDRSVRPTARVFDLLLLAPMVATMAHEDTRSFGPDVAVAALALVAASGLHRLLTRGGARWRAVVVGVLLATAVTVKLSAAAFALAGWALLLPVLLRPPAPRRRRALALAGGLALLLGVSWAARGVVLSGHPAYPSPAASVPVEWRVPAEQASAELAWTVRHGRGPRPAGGLGWVGPWLGTMTNPYRAVRVPLPLGLTLLGLGAWAWAAARGRRRGGAPRPPPGAGDRPGAGEGRGWWLLLPVAAGLTLWLVTSPHPRFGFWLFWAAAATTVARAADRLAPLGRLRRRAAAAVVGAGLLLGAWPVLEPAARRAAEGGDPLAALSFWLVRAPGPEAGLHPMPTAELDTVRTDSGLRLYVPRHDNRCWDAPLPCTPHPAPNLRLREPGDLSSGFRVEGPWRPEHWPNPGSDFLRRWRAERGDHGAGRGSGSSAPSPGRGSLSR